MHPESADTSDASSGGWASAGAKRPAIYLLLVLCVTISVFAYRLRVEGIFACPAGAYSSDVYLAYCNSVGYGDYDHGAFWLDLEPVARRAAAAADVLFLGNSRMQLAFSSAPAREWFAKRGTSFYLLGFSHNENEAFAGPLLSGLAPRAKVYVVNVDRFFTEQETPPVAEILHGENVESRYRRKKIWQYPHRFLCTALSVLCGENLAFFRARSDGTWRLEGSERLAGSGVGDDPKPGDGWSEEIDLAQRFVAHLPVDPHCVVLTVVPTKATPRAEAQAVASALGLDLLAPTVEGLHTFDGSHLDAESAQRWASEFFRVAGPRISDCLTGSTVPRSDSGGSYGPSAAQASQ